MDLSKSWKILSSCLTYFSFVADRTIGTIVSVPSAMRCWYKKIKQRVHSKAMGGEGGFSRLGILTDLARKIFNLASTFLSLPDPDLWAIQASTRTQGVYIFGLVVLVQAQYS